MPAWTNPKTWTAALVTVADLNTHIRDNDLYLYQSRLGGFVNADGSINTGSLFTSVRNSTGVYTVTYSTAFASNPAVVVTPFGGVSVIVPILVSSGTTSFQVNFRNASATLTDTIFSFQALQIV